ncbi:hypothetical protein HJC23_004579 [Cyclotella cryptica]|uniref:Uncharacterized protein n=1 Tax=Cyclotella cryptica TaxID=29204 RepID=A0ABD3QB61_9STRA
MIVQKKTKETVIFGRSKEIAQGNILWDRTAMIFRNGGVFAGGGFAGGENSSDDYQPSLGRERPLIGQQLLVVMLHSCIAFNFIK